MFFFFSKGQPCPFNCDAVAPTVEAFYPIADPADTCYQWPGGSGTNSMKSGECNVDKNTYTYQQWSDNCGCSGNSGSVATTKEVPYGIENCVVDNPPSLCQVVVDYSACQAGGVQEKESSVYLRAK